MSHCSVRVQCEVNESISKHVIQDVMQIWVVILAFATSQGGGFNQPLSQTPSPLFDQGSLEHTNTHMLATT